MTDRDRSFKCGCTMIESMQLFYPAMIQPLLFDNNQKSEIRNQKSEIRNQKSENIFEPSNLKGFLADNGDEINS